MLAAQLKIACTKKMECSIKQIAAQKNVFIEDQSLIDIKFITSEEVRHYLTDNTYSYIFTSSNAVSAILAHCHSVSIIPANPCFAISGATQELLSLHMLNVVATANTSKILANKILDYGSQAVVHFTAKEHRRDLYIALAEHNVICETVLVYEKQQIAKKFGDFDAVLFFSPMQVDIFLYLNNLPKNTPIFCIGETTAEYCTKLEFTKVIISPTPTQKALLLCVFEYFNLK
jgi:uroporphyrinogen-III synthase